MPKVIVGTRGTSKVPEFAGSTWVRMQYVLGLAKLGIDSFWVDRITYRQRSERHSLDYLMTRFHRTACDFGFADRYCVVCNEGERYFGLNEREYHALAADADLLINISGHLPSSSPLMRVPRRAFLDVDPGFTQIWAHTYDLGFDKHNFFFTIGQNVGRPEFRISTAQILWHRMTPPVVLDAWPSRIDEQCDRFSTVADWRTSQETDFEGTHYGGKRSEFLRLLDLPGATRQTIELALWIEPFDFEDLGALTRHGWDVVNPCLNAGDPQSYREYIQRSRGEFSVAKHGYVESNSGWISDRTVCYLSSGKPALVQSTGFESCIPTGSGLVTYRTMAEAVAGFRAINDDYVAHCHRARHLAEQYFDSDVVLGQMLGIVGV